MSSQPPSQPQTGVSSQQPQIQFVTVSKDFNLKNYISNYSGHGRIRRLIFIADHVKELETEALNMLAVELKNTTNVQLYKMVMERTGAKADREWMDTTDKKANWTLEKLEQELNTSKVNLAKENIRVGHNEIGDFYYHRGDLPSALKSYVRSRDYCTTPHHILAMYMNVIRVSLETEQWNQVANYVSKAESSTDVSQNKLKVCSGLAQLANKKYKIAARKFLEVTFDISNSYNEVVSPQDIAIYGGITALANFDRQELKRKVLDNPEFKNFLELVPDVREMINDFYSSRYASCLNLFEKIKSDLLLDIHLHEHVSGLYEKIRTKALIQYFSPFTSVSLEAMAEAFNTNLAGLERELSKLIMEGSIQARIDSHNKILYARHTDQRNATFQNALKMGEEYQRNAKAMILRMNLMRHDFIVKPPRPKDEKNKQTN